MSHFVGDRYNVMTTNVAESWNIVLVEAREFLLIFMLEYIHTIIMRWFPTRRGKVMVYKCSVTLRIRSILEDNFEQSHSLTVKPIGPDEFQVTTLMGVNYAVNLVKKICDCRQFDLLTHLIWSCSFSSSFVASS